MFIMLLKGIWMHCPVCGSTQTVLGLGGMVMECRNCDQLSNKTKHYIESKKSTETNSPIVNEQESPKKRGRPTRTKGD
jgi:hypothetical protein